MFFKYVPKYFCFFVLIVLTLHTVLHIPRTQFESVLLSEKPVPELSISHYVKHRQKWLRKEQFRSSRYIRFNSLDFKIFFSPSNTVYPYWSTSYLLTIIHHILMHCLTFVSNSRLGFDTDTLKKRGNGTDYITTARTIVRKKFKSAAVFIKLAQYSFKIIYVWKIPLPDLKGCCSLLLSLSHQNFISLVRWQIISYPNEDLYLYPARKAYAFFLWISSLLSRRSTLLSVIACSGFSLTTFIAGVLSVS